MTPLEEKLITALRAVQSCAQTRNGTTVQMAVALSEMTPRELRLGRVLREAEQ